MCSRFAFYRHACMEVERGFWPKRMQTTSAIMGSGNPRPSCMNERALARGRTGGGDGYGHRHRKTVRAHGSNRQPHAWVDSHA